MSRSKEKGEEVVPAACSKTIVDWNSKHGSRSYRSKIYFEGRACGS